MNILIAMDNSVYSKYIEYRLRLLDNHVKTVSDGLEALNSLHESRWDKLLIGITLTHLNGLEVISKYHTSKKTETLQIFIITRVKYEKTIKSAFELGISGYLQIPLNISTLIDKLTA